MRLLEALRLRVKDVDLERPGCKRGPGGAAARTVA